MKPPVTLHLSCSHSALASAIVRIAAELETAGADPASIYAARVIAEELGTNVIKYAYPEGQCDTFTVMLTLHPPHFTLTVEDHGTPFNPLDCPPPDLTLPLEERPIGGLGIHLVRKLSDRVTYERRDDKNIIAVERRLQDSNPPS